MTHPSQPGQSGLRPNLTKSARVILFAASAFGGRTGASGCFYLSHAQVTATRGTVLSPAAKLAARHYGPLSSAVAPLLETPRQRSATEEDAAVQLGRLLDFRGSVELAAIVGQGSREWEGPLVDPSRAAQLRADLADDLAEVRAQLTHAFSRWTAQRSQVAGPEALAAALAPRVSLGFAERRTSTIAEAVWGPVAEEALKELTLARRSARRIRKDLEPALVALGVRAARLCELDRVLSEAIEPAVQARMERMIAATQAHAVRLLSAHIEKLPVGDASQTVAQWLAHMGPIRQGLAIFAKVVRAGLEVEERRMTALVEASLEAEIPSSALGNA